MSTIAIKLEDQVSTIVIKLEDQVSTIVIKLVNILLMLCRFTFDKLLCDIESIYKNIRMIKIR